MLIKEAKEYAKKIKSKAIYQAIGGTKMGFFEMLTRPVIGEINTIEEAEAYAICIKAYEEARAIRLKASHPDLHQHIHIHIGDEETEDLTPSQIRKVRGILEGMR